MARPFNVEKTVFSTNGAGETGYAHAKEWSWTQHRIQKLTLKTEQQKDKQPNSKVGKGLE